MKNIIVWVLAIIILVTAILFGVNTFLLGAEKSGVVSDSSGYQAVFLVNGQVYFGKLANESRPFVMLTDVYYLQVNQALQPAGEGAAQAPDVSLIKLGNELHGPTDAMRINSDQILLIEDLKTDSNVVKAIAEYKRTPAAAPAN